MNGKKIPGFPSYMVYPDGRVFSGRYGRYLKPFLWGDRSKKGSLYPAVNLYKDGKQKTKKLSHVVLETFVGPRPEGMCAAHLDGNKDNNRLENLAWTSYRENELHKIKHGTQPLGEQTNSVKLTAEQVKEIRKRHKTTGYRINNTLELAAEFKVTQTTIHRIITRRTWKHV